MKFLRKEYMAKSNLRMCALLIQLDRIMYEFMPILQCPEILMIATLSIADRS